MLCIPDRQRKSLRPVLRRALNDNQILLLNAIKHNSFPSVSSLLNHVSSSHGVPLSTLRLNVRVMLELGLAEVNSSHAELTGLGRLVLEMLNDR